MKAKKLLTILMVCVICGISVIAPLCGCSKGYEKFSSVVFSSGMTFEASLYGGNPASATSDMLELFDAVDKAVNISRSDSYLSTFNAAASGVNVEVDSITYCLAQASQEAYLQTDGAFNPALSEVSKAWGVDNEGISKYVYGDEKMTSLPSYEQLMSFADKTDMTKALSVFEAGGKYYLKKSIDGFTLDFGGIAKGYCADECKKIALKHGITSGVIKISGNVMLIGDYIVGSENKAWGVGVVAPRGFGYVCAFDKRGTATAVTSGDYERCYFFGDDNLRVCHIIDGNTLMPIGIRVTDGVYSQSSSYVVSATIIGESSMFADIYSTAVCVMGAEAGYNFVTEKGYEAIIFTSDKKRIISPTLSLKEDYTTYTEYQPI